MADPSVVEGLTGVRIEPATAQTLMDWGVLHITDEGWVIALDIWRTRASPSPEGVEELVEQCRSKSRQLFPERMRDGYSYHAIAALLDQAADTIERLSAAPPSVERSRR